VSHVLERLRREFFIDTCIFIYAAGADHPLKQPCVEILRAVADGRIRAVIDVEVVQEILYRHQRIGQIEEGLKIARQALAIAHVVYSIEEEDVRFCLEMFGKYAKKGVKARDLIHVAVMNRMGISDIISADKDFDEVEGIRRHDPLEWVRG